MRELSLFTGAGGGLLASSLLGFDTVAAVEIDPFCRSVIQARQNDGILSRFPIFEDVRTFDPDPWVGKVDLVTGGFPCQDISCAGKGGGINGPKSGLWWDMWRICCGVGAGFIFLENSPEIATRGLSEVLGALASRGWDAEWIVLGAAHFGAPHIRERLWFLGADPNMPARSQFQPQEQIHYIFGDGEGEKSRWKDQPSRSICNPWGEGIPEFCRVSDGISGRMDRLISLGNGQVPRVAAAAFSILWNRLHQSS